MTTSTEAFRDKKGFGKKGKSMRFRFENMERGCRWTAELRETESVEYSADSAFKGKHPAILRGDDRTFKKGMCWSDESLSTPSLTVSHCSLSGTTAMASMFIIRSGRQRVCDVKGV